jgi:uncharacterized OB-fold protein
LKTSPITYWRESQKQKSLLGKKGKLLSFTKNQATNSWIGIVKLTGGKKITAPLIFNTKKPQINDSVVAVVRILKKPNSEDLIEYGIKFQFQSEL